MPKSLLGVCISIGKRNSKPIENQLSIVLRENDSPRTDEIESTKSNIYMESTQSKDARQTREANEAISDHYSMMYHLDYDGDRERAKMFFQLARAKWFLAFF